MFAAVVRVIERMKKKNVEASRAPDSTPAAPMSRTLPITRPRFMSAMVATRKIAMNTERQTMISNGSAARTLRTRMPPRLQHSPAPTISRTPLRRSARSRVKPDSPLFPCHRVRPGRVDGSD